MKNDLTEIIFLLDRSGSMAGLESDTIGGFNAFVEKQSKMSGETLVTAVLFDDKYEVLWNGISATNARLTEKDYYVRGCTALLDAVGKTILNAGLRITRMPEIYRPEKVIVVITTDGLENASREFTYTKIKDLIKRKKEIYQWEFIFLGANIDAVKEADSIGINSEDAHQFEATAVGVERMYDLVCEAVSEKRTD